jgi:holo-ACP synthase CitX
MARSSTPCAASGRSLLTARDGRQILLDRHLGAGRTLLALSLAIPGEEKSPPGAAALFAWAAAEVARAFPGAELLEAEHDALGPFALWAAPEDARAAKLRAASLEAARPAARLVDLDVYSPEGASLDRDVLHLPARPCLLCDEPARACIRARRHDHAELAARARSVLAGA